ncbi:MAG: hypothetical protein HN341_18850 [Verrucomicrobia bacterium]|jgi:competence protein ComGC|nr:hypothetical protein [Verrucomicrobiota bacterium]
MNRRRKDSGFTLGEIMFVVLTIALLNVLAIPAFKQARLDSLATVTASGFRAYSDGFTMHAAETGQWATRAARTRLPSGVDGYVDSKQFSAPTPVGGYWRWLGPTRRQIRRGNISAQIRIVGIRKGNIELLERIDEILDDGNLGTGQLTGSKRILIFTME